MHRLQSVWVGIISVVVVACSSPTQPQIDKLKTVPYTALITAGTAALRSAAQELGRPALTWEVIADDKYVMRECCDWADSIPLVAGSVFSEFVHCHELARQPGEPATSVKPTPPPLALRQEIG